MDLSIIIPIYNTPTSVLTRCFDAIQFTNGITYEVILVDDGSGEETAAFCRNYGQEHEAFRYFYQQNKGVSAARNAGLRYATGQYVSFLDADDVLICDNLQSRYLKGEYDIVLCDLERHDHEHKTRMRIFDCAAERVLSLKECLSAACSGRMNSACGRLFRRQMLLDNGIAFDEQMLTAEDAVFVLKSLQSAQKLYYGQEPFYRYFHSYTSGNKRLERFPQKIFDNLTLLYTLRNELLAEKGAQWGLTQRESDSLRSATAGLFVHAVFESVSMLAAANVTCDSVFSKAREQIGAIDSVCRKQFSMKLRMKYWILKYDLTWMMRLFARLRSVYLRMKQ